MAKKDKKDSTAVSKDLNNISEANKLWADNMARAKEVTDSISKLNNTFINKAVPNPYPNKAIRNRKMGGVIGKKC
jgi:hypothetical protein